MSHSAIHRLKKTRGRFMWVCCSYASELWWKDEALKLHEWINTVKYVFFSKESQFYVKWLHLVFFSFIFLSSFFIVQSEFIVWIMCSVQTLSCTTSTFQRSSFWFAACCLFQPTEERHLHKHPPTKPGKWVCHSKNTLRVVKKATTIFFFSRVLYLLSMADSLQGMTSVLMQQRWMLHLNSRGTL